MKIFEKLIEQAKFALKINKIKKEFPDLSLSEAIELAKKES